jgi:hypothetical protein
MTFSNDPRFVGPTVEMMMGSREAVVDYMTPLGLHHLMGRPSLRAGGRGSRAARAPTGLRSTITGPTPTASASTARPSGSDATAQYAPQVAAGVQRRGAHRRARAAVVPPPALGLPDAVGPPAVGRAGDHLRPRRRDGRRHAPDLGGAGPYVDASGSARFRPSWPSRSRRPSGGATPASPISWTSRAAPCRTASRHRLIPWPGTRRCHFRSHPETEACRTRQASGGLGFAALKADAIASRSGLARNSAS